jgi:hypothetical protein
MPLILALLFIANFAHADPGFFAASAYRIPSAVEQAGNSVVKIILLDSTTKTALGSGSAFVVEDSKTLWTAAHVVEHSEIDRANLQIQLENTLGQKIFDTTSGDRALVIEIGSKDKDSQDYAKIILSRPLDLRPIAINTKQPDIGATLYSVGFPVIDSVAPPSTDSILQSIPQSRVTFGQNIAASTANVSVALTRSPAEVDTMDKILARKLIFIDADGYFGQSGSPIFNEEGEAVGIFTAIIRSQDSGPGTQIKTQGMGPSFSGILEKSP